MFSDHDQLMVTRIKRGEVVLILGAGANAGSENRRGDQILFGRGLARKIAEEIGEPYNNEPLSEVTSAATHLIGKDGIRPILIQEFRYCKPSKQLTDLFNYTWNRIYTWNYDDALAEASRGSVQRLYSYNGMRASVEDIDRKSNLQMIYLHGQITALDD